MARLVYTDHNGQECQVPFGPEQPLVTIGRATDCTIRSNRKSVSRHHAEFHYHQGRFEVVDLGSSNGTYLIVDDERQPLVRQILADNDEVWCGDFILRFFMADIAEDPYAGVYGQSVGFGNSYAPEIVPPVSAPAVSFGKNFGARPTAQPSWPTEAIDLEEDYPDLDPEYEAYDPSDDMRRLEDEKRSLEEMTARQASELEQIQMTLRSRERELDGRQRELDARQRELEARKREIESRDREIGQLRQKLQDLERQLQQQLEERAQRELFLVADSDEASDAEEDKGAVFQELSTLRREVERVRELDRHTQRLEAHVQELESDLARSREISDGLNLRLDEMVLAATRALELESDLGAREQELGELRTELHEVQGRLDDALVALADVQRDVSSAHNLSAQAERFRADMVKAQKEADELRHDMERQSRLMAEFERRTRELQADNDRQLAAREILRQENARAQARLQELGQAEETLSRLTASWEDERVSFYDRINDIEDERERAKVRAEALEQEMVDLRAENEGFKRRLKMERERVRESDVRRLELDNLDMSERLAQLSDRVATLSVELEEARKFADETAHQLPPEPAPLSAVGTSFAAVFAELNRRLESLDRVLDALERADLQPLSTVDRVRLQAALRDTAPRRLLQELRSLTARHSTGA